MLLSPLLLKWIVVSVVLLQQCGMAVLLPVSGPIWLHLPMDGHQVWFVTQALSCLFALLLAAGDILLSWSVLSVVLLQLCGMAAMWFHVPMHVYQGSPDHLMLLTAHSPIPARACG